MLSIPEILEEFKFDGGKKERRNMVHRWNILIPLRSQIKIRSRAISGGAKEE
jgi:hypothetical protein